MMRFLLITLLFCLFISEATLVSAQSSCQRTIACPEGGVMTCTSQIDENGVCNPNLPGASCSACTQPQTDPQAISPAPSQPSSRPSAPPDSSPQTPNTQNPSPSPSVITPDEAALYKLNKSTLPGKLETSIQPKPKSLFDSIADLFSRFVSTFGFRPYQPDYFASRAEIQSQTELPDELKPSGDIIEQTGQNLGGETGVHSLNLPSQVKNQAITTQDFEALDEKANYPPGVRPITKK